MEAGEKSFAVKGRRTLAKWKWEMKRECESVCKEKQRQKGMLCGKFEGLLLLRTENAFFAAVVWCYISSSEVIEWVPLFRFWTLLQPKCPTFLPQLTVLPFAARSNFKLQRSD